MQDNINLVKDRLAAYEHELEDEDSILMLQSVYVRDIQTLLTEIEKLKVKPKNTWCAYCGYEVDIDDDAASKISEHIQSCPSHPMRVWERHCEALEEQNKKLKAARNRYFEALNVIASGDRTAHESMLWARQALIAAWEREEMK